MENNVDFTTEKDFFVLKTINKQFDINCEKLETIEDIKSVLKGLQISVHLYSETIPEHLKECFEKEFLVERK